MHNRAFLVGVIYIIVMIIVKSFSYILIITNKILNENELFT